MTRAFLTSPASTMRLETRNHTDDEICTLAAPSYFVSRKHKNVAGRWCLFMRKLEGHLSYLLGL